MTIPRQCTTAKPRTGPEPNASSSRPVQHPTTPEATVESPSAPMPRRTIVAGETFASKNALEICTVLGSCVAACLYDPVTRIGGLIAGDVPTFRVEHMPYGGVKDSGLGREGLRDSIQEMTEPKLLVMNLR